LVDTSAWVEFLRATGSVTHRRLHELVESDRKLQTTDVVVMEVLAGARNEPHAARLRRLLMRCEFVSTEGLGDFEQAAALYRRCRRAGEPVGTLNHCLVVAVALRVGVDVLQSDRDFDALARITELELYSETGHDS
jgi:predicted nucleic acid-binding protein